MDGYFIYFQFLAIVSNNILINNKYARNDEYVRNCLVCISRSITPEL